MLHFKIPARAQSNFHYKTRIRCEKMFNFRHFLKLSVTIVCFQGPNGGVTSSLNQHVHQQKYLREIDLHYQESPASAATTVGRGPDDVSKTCHLREIQLRVSVTMEHIRNVKVYDALSRIKEDKKNNSMRQYHSYMNIV